MSKFLTFCSDSKKVKEEEAVSFLEYTIRLFKAKSALALLHLDYIIQT